MNRRMKLSDHERFMIMTERAANRRKMIELGEQYRRFGPKWYNKLMFWK